LTKIDDSVEIFDGRDSDWIEHPDGDDVAIRPLGALPEREYLYLEPPGLLTEAELQGFGVGPGDDCVMVGRYINHKGEQLDRPVARFGNLAMMPAPAWQPERSFDQLSFLVDMRSHAGFSGSPVFVYYQSIGPRGSYEPGDAPPGYDLLEQEWSGVIAKMWLLGIDWGHLPVWDEVVDEHKQKIGRVCTNSGIAGVVPAWKLARLLEDQRRAREESERELFSGGFA
jgi:hypothetical protein